MLKKLVWGLLLVMPRLAFALEAVGVVTVLNGTPKATLKLYGEDQKLRVTVCEGQLSARLTKLAGMQVQLDGQWQPSPKTSASCFQASALTVLKTSSGRPAITGTLVAKDKGLAIAPARGDLVLLPLSAAQLGEYQKMLGHVVIADLKTFASGPKLVTLILHP